jgi:hypothetical protein
VVPDPTYQRPTARPLPADLSAYTLSLLRYERAKRAWIAAHPDAGPRDYEAAMTRIARAEGI